MRQLHRDNAMIYAYKDTGYKWGGGREPPVLDSSGSGLVHGHGYSALQLLEVAGAEGSAPLQLVQLRNIWGEDYQWRGAWADGSAEWEQFPEIRRHHLRPEYHGSGRFWMLWAAFCAIFDRIDVCPMPEAARKASYAPPKGQKQQEMLRMHHARATGGESGFSKLFSWQCCSVEKASDG